MTTDGHSIWLCDAHALCAPGAEDEALSMLYDCGLHERAELSLRYKRDSVRHLSLAAGLALAAALDAYGMPDKDHPRLSFSQGEYGKPYLTDYPHIHFNLSHSGHYGACAVADTELGLDIQDVRSCDMALAERFFHEAEAKALRSATASGDTAADILFTRIWTRKEAYLKLRGTGLSEDTSTFSVLDGALPGILLQEAETDSHLLCLATYI